MIIYLATNLCNDKVYVGQTVRTLRYRSCQHNSEATRQKRNSHFHNAIRKYGKYNFKWEQIDCAKSQEELNEKEISWISYYKSTDKHKGYNKSVGGGVNSVHQDTRDKISKALKGRIFTEEHKRKISAAKKGIKLSALRKKRLVDGWKKSNYWTEERRIALSVRMMAENLSIETREKISDANTGEGNGRSILTPLEVFAIKSMLFDGSTCMSIAKAYNVGRSAIANIKRNKTWKHIPWPVEFAGVCHGNSLHIDDVARIKKKICDGLSFQDILGSESMSKSQLSLIMNNKTWTDVPWPKGYVKYNFRSPIGRRDALKIKQMLYNGARECDVARELNISRNIVQSIKSNKTWKDIPWP